METGRAQPGRSGGSVGSGRAAAPARGTDADAEAGVGAGVGADAEADALAIDELASRIRHLWPGLPEAVREDLADCLVPLTAAAQRRDTDSRAVRETLQTVLLIVGTGALATLSVASRRRLAALTGIALPERIR
ncbi:hypothetical protein ABH926_009309 [Catenulispora sp. GP43]|uniref:hypothetical protein n=1 Tax=Catenulispora sp. GP43 TaxID=3156263 RepID=UPI003517C3A7